MVILTGMSRPQRDYKLWWFRRQNIISRFPEADFVIQKRDRPSSKDILEEMSQEKRRHSLQRLQQWMAYKWIIRLYLSLLIFFLPFSFLHPSCHSLVCTASSRIRVWFGCSLFLVMSFSRKSRVFSRELSWHFAFGFKSILSSCKTSVIQRTHDVMFPWNPCQKSRTREFGDKCNDFFKE